MARYDLVFEDGTKVSVFDGALKAFLAAGHTHRRLVVRTRPARSAYCVGD